jgi:hypothetical protein
LRLTRDDSAWAAGASVEYEISHTEDGRNRFETRFVLSRQGEVGRLGLNIFAGHGGTDERTGEPREGLDWNYAAGLRRRLVSRVDWGVEGQGEFSSNGVHELLAGLYTDPSDRVTINIGAGVGLGPDAPSFTLRSAVVVRLR